MDPASLIEAALVAGAAASAKDTAGQAIKDAYSGLKTLLSRLFADKPKVLVVLDEYDVDPETYEKPLKKLLTEVHVEEEKDIIEAAQRLMSLVQPQQAALGKYNVQITGGVQGYAQGDYQQVNMNFGNQSEKMQ